MIEQSYLSSVIRIALEVEKSGGPGYGKALNIPVNSWADGERLREEAKDIIREYNRTAAEPIKHVRPWRWRYPESGGQAMSERGKQTGFEIRLSYFLKENGY